jgi:hypothetical protein
MKRIQLAAFVALLSASMLEALPAALKFTPKKGGYKSADGRSAYYQYRAGLFAPKVTAALRGIGAERYVLVAAVTKTYFFGSAANIAAWQGDQVNNPQGDACPVNGMMNFYEENPDGTYSVLYTVRGFNDPTQKTSAGLALTSAAGFQNSYLAPELGVPGTQGTGTCGYPTVASPMQLSISNAFNFNNMKDAFTAMAQFGAQESGILKIDGTSATIPAPAGSSNPTITVDINDTRVRNLLKRTQGIGGILFYNAAGNFVAAFYTNGWNNHTEGWTDALPGGVLNTIQAQQ